MTLICRLFISKGALFATHAIQSLSTAQVPDDEQFVPDFQSESCEYLKMYYLFSLAVYFGCGPEMAGGKRQRLNSWNYLLFISCSNLKPKFHGKQRRSLDQQESGAEWPDILVDLILLMMPTLSHTNGAHCIVYIRYFSMH